MPENGEDKLLLNFVFCYNCSMSKFSPRQMAFQEIFIGSLIFASVLGIFNDYSNIVYATSFSTILLASFVLELLTFATFWLKKKVVKFISAHFRTTRNLHKLVSVWPIAFLSKFVFIWVLDLLFNDYIYIKGFFGILLVVLTVVVIQRLALWFFMYLGKQEK